MSKNPDVYRAANRRYYYRNRQKILDQKREYHARNAESRHEREHAYRKPYLKVYMDNDGEMICSECGAIDSLVIHHIDGDHENNSPNNLTCLCDSCHSKAHNETRRRDRLGRYTS